MNVNLSDYYDSTYYSTNRLCQGFQATRERSIEALIEVR
jgi:hypothetical protein